MRTAAVAFKRIDDILFNQISSIRELRSRADQALHNWGVWSRIFKSSSEEMGSKPIGAKGSDIFIRYSCGDEHQPVDRNYFVDMPTRKAHGVVEGMDPAEDDEHADLKLGEQVDCLIHLPEFDDEEGRRKSVLRAVYFYQAPYWQWTQDAKVRHHLFLPAFDTALSFIGQRL